MNIANFPQKLKRHKNFVLWRREQKGDKITKIPYSPRTLERASTTNPDDWTDLDDALKAMELGGFSGIGFVFSEDAGIVGIDLDHCIADGKLSKFAIETIEALDSYTEVSPSNTGVHILAEATYLGTGIHTAAIEIYGRGRFFTLTGTLVGEQSTVESRQAEVDDLVKKFGRDGISSQGSVQPLPSCDENPSQLVETYCQNDYHRRLWTHEVSHKSQSEYDIAIASTALHSGLTDDDAARLIYENRRFHNTDLGKAQRASYVADTIAKAKQSQGGSKAAQLVKAATKDAQESADIVAKNPFLDLYHAMRHPKKLKWLIKNYIPATGIIWIAGQWSTKKTFLTIGMAIHIATGRKWCGNKVTQGKVLYITGEGALGLGHRGVGTEMGLNMEMLEGAVWFTEHAIMLNDREAVSKLLLGIKTHLPDLAAIFVDTKAANMRGNDGDGGVMNDWVNAVREIELHLHCVVVVIDHVGHMDKGRPRGSSVQMGAADAVYMVGCDTNNAPNNILFDTLKDPKDFRRPKPIHFLAKEIVLPFEFACEGESEDDEDYEPPTSLCLIQTEEDWEGVTQDEPSKPSKPYHSRTAIEVLHELYEGYGENLDADGRPTQQALVATIDWQKACLFRGITKTNFRSIKARLLNNGILTLSEGGHHIKFTESYI